MDSENKKGGEKAVDTPDTIDEKSRKLVVNVSPKSDDLESIYKKDWDGSTVTTPVVNEATNLHFRRVRMVQYLTLCWCFVLEGWNDGSLGPLLPRIQESYKISYTVVSLLYVILCVGYIIGAVLNIYLSEKLGFGKTITLGTALQPILYMLIIPQPPYPVIVLGFGIYGFACALQNAQVNSFVARLKNPTKMAILHACYGSGAFASPFVSTQFSTKKHWSYHYFTALGVAVSALVALLVVFRLGTVDDILVSGGLPPRPEKSPDEKKSNYKQILSLRTIHVLSFFILCYCGAEVTVGGWAVNYIIKRTGAGPSAGYVSSGFFGGLALGRVLLIWVNKKIGERRVIFVYAIITICLEIIIWAIPEFIPSAICFSFVGFFLGPMFPILMNQCGNLIPPQVLSGGIGWICSFGLVGCALVPFATGALTDHFGVISLQPLIISLLVMLCIFWAIANYGHQTKTQMMDDSLKSEC